MQSKYLFLLAAILLLVIGCSSQKNIEDNDNGTIDNSTGIYQVISSADYDESLCSNVIDEGSNGGYSFGISLSIKDKSTGKKLEGKAKANTKIKSTGLSVGSEGDYSCFTNSASKRIVISTLSKGHSPISFIYDIEPNKLVALEAPLRLSCNGAPSCFDNLKVEFGDYFDKNESLAGDAVELFKLDFDIQIYHNFGLNETDYNLSCIECDLDRGGFMKGRGTYKDGTEFDFYFREGWCSQGGSDCGHETCIETDENGNDLIQAVKETACNDLYSVRYKDVMECKEILSDDSEATRQGCLTGDYESNDEYKLAFSIVQVSERCDSSVKKGSFNCLGN